MIGKRAVVIGAGIGGLASAQALADHFEQVIVLERDRLPSGAMVRPGVPQGRHQHALMAGGLVAFNDLFAGFSDSLKQAGACLADAGRDVRTELPGLPAFPARELGLTLSLQSRPLCELVIRQRLLRCGNVVLQDGCRVGRIIASADQRSVAGVEIDTRDRARQTLSAEVVVDASGRAEPTLELLNAVGQRAPEETVLGVDLCYATATYAFPDPSRVPTFKALVTLAQAPQRSRCGFMMEREGGLWFVLLVGRGNDWPPVGEQAFIEFARDLDTRTLYDTIRHGERQGEIVRFAFPESRRRHFDRVPHGLIPIADAVCRLNPVYGHGMAVAAQQAVVLRNILASLAPGADAFERLSQEFLVAIESVIDGPWAISNASDLVYPQTRGPRPEGFLQSLASQAELNRMAIDDADLHRSMAEVMHLVKRPK